jgi:uncharacterized FlaG/YvyC family protein
VQIYSDLTSVTSSQAIATPQVSETNPSASAVRNAVRAINESELLGFDRELRFSTDPLSKLGYVQVVERSSGEVIAQIPSQFTLNLAENLQKRN